jgi:putative CRISPR-associated protein (TIGR02620 family)
MRMTIIVTRHTGLIQWLKSHGIVGDVISHVEFPDQIRGKDVYGVLPLHLASVCNSVTTVDMPGLPSEKRGVDLTPEEMDSFGAIMHTYIVQEVV